MAILTEPPNLNPPIFYNGNFRAQLPNLISANISGYTVIIYYTCTQVILYQTLNLIPVDETKLTTIFVVPYTTKFSPAKIFAKSSYYVLG